MKLKIVAPRTLAIVLAVSISLPPPVFALRTQEKVEGAGLEELTQTLQSSDHVAAIKTVATRVAIAVGLPSVAQSPPVRPPSPTVSAGMEEQGEKLGFRAWMATFGSWGPTRRALRKFDQPIRQDVRSQINALVKRTIEKHELKEARARDLLSSLPEVIQALRADYLLSSLALTARAVEQKHDPGFILFTLKKAAQSLPEEQFLAAVALGNRLLDEKIDPNEPLRGLLAIASVSTKPEIFASHLSSLEELAMLLDRRRISSYSTMYEGLPTAAQTLTQEQFSASLDLAVRLAQEGMNPGPVLQYGVPVLAKASLHPEDFQENLKALEEFQLQLWTAVADASDVFSELYNRDLPIIAEVSSVPRRFQPNLRAFGDLVLRLVRHRQKVGEDYSYSSSRSYPYVQTYVQNLFFYLRSAAQTMTPELFPAGLSFAARMVEQGIDPEGILQTALPVVARISPTSQDFQTNLQILDEYLSRLKGTSLFSPKYHLYLEGAWWSSFSVLERLSPSSREFEQNLQSLWEIGSVYGGLTRSVFKVVIPMVAQTSRTGGELRGRLKAVEEFLRGVAFADHWIDLDDTFYRGLPALIYSSPGQEALKENLGLLRRLILSLAHKSPDQAPSGWVAYDLYAVHDHALNDGVPRLAKSLSPECFTLAMELSALLAEKRIDPGPLMDSILITSLAEISPTVDAFRVSLQALGNFYIRAWKEWNFAHGDGKILRVTSQVIRSNLPPEFFRESLLVLETLLSRLISEPTLDWKKLPQKELENLTLEAIHLRLQGRDYALKVSHWSETVFEEVESGVNSEGIYYKTGGYESVERVIVHQDVQLIPQGHIPPSSLEKGQAGLEEPNRQGKEAVPQGVAPEYTPFMRGQGLARQLASSGVRVWQGLVRADDPNVVAVDPIRVAALSDRPQGMELTLEIPTNLSLAKLPEGLTVWVDPTLKEAVIRAGWGVRIETLPSNFEESREFLRKNAKSGDLVLLDRKNYSFEKHQAWRATLGDLSQQGLWVTEKELSTMDRDEFAITFQILRNSGEILPAVGLEEKIEGTQHRFLYA